MKNSKPLLVYFSLAYFFSWIVFILLALNHQKIIFLFSESKANERLADIWHSFGALGPFLSAVITLRYFYAKNQWRQFIKGYSVNKINYSGWFLSLSPLVFFVVAIVANGMITQHWFSFSEFFRSNELLTPFNFIALLLPSLFYGFFEEVGWRGFALPALQKRNTAIISTVILTILWVGWHFPSFFYRYNLTELPG